MSNLQVKQTPLFELGSTVMTRGVYESGLDAHQINEMLSRHVYGDFGETCAEDIETNFQAIEHGMRIMSSYAIDDDKPCKGYGDNCIWVITEADRSVTTLLLPSEY